MEVVERSLKEAEIVWGVVKKLDRCTSKGSQRMAIPPVEPCVSRESFWYPLQQKFERVDSVSIQNLVSCMKTVVGFSQQILDLRVIFLDFPHNPRILQERICIDKILRRREGPAGNPPRIDGYLMLLQFPLVWSVIVDLYFVPFFIFLGFLWY